MTDHLSMEDLETAAEILRAGGTLAFATETVYGLGADAGNARAVAKVYAAKGRPSFNPLIVHVPDLEAAQAIGVFDAELLRLAQAFWPGALSLVVPLRPGAPICQLVTAGLDTVALRVPGHADARALLRAADCPVAAPSANPSGQISPTTAAHVLEGLSGRIDAVLDGGPCRVGLESTIVGGTPPRLLREGGVPREALEACLGHPLLLATSDDPIIAPGQLRSHYAPRAPLSIGSGRDDHVVIGFGPEPCDLNLSERGDLVEAAARLFSCLREADDLAQQRGVPISVPLLPMEGLGRAINDRLARAAAPRD